MHIYFMGNMQSPRKAMPICCEQKREKSHAWSLSSDVLNVFACFHPRSALHVPCLFVFIPVPLPRRSLCVVVASLTAVPVLVHAKARAGGADVMIRAQERDTAAAVAALLQRAWA